MTHAACQGWDSPLHRWPCLLTPHLILGTVIYILLIEKLRLKSVSTHTHAFECRELKLSIPDTWLRCLGIFALSNVRGFSWWGPYGSRRVPHWNTQETFRHNEDGSVDHNESNITYLEPETVQSLMTMSSDPILQMSCRKFRGVLMQSVLQVTSGRRKSQT